MAWTLYHYPGCSTCRQARRWFAEQGLENELRLVDIVEAPPSAAELGRFWKRSGLALRKLFNTSGQSYRQGGYKEKLPTLSDKQALAALAADGKLIKRPLLVGPETVLVGFRPAEWAEQVGSGSI